MKRISILSFLLVGAVAVGCSTTGGTRSDYFGYDNTARENEQDFRRKTAQSATPPDAQAAVDSVQTTDDSNQAPAVAMTPADNRSNPFALNTTGDVYIENYYAADPEVEYIPVMVPWWERYYDPFYYQCTYRRPVFVVSWSYYDAWCYDRWWYAPQYYHHPYYGWNYHPGVIYPPVVHYPPDVHVDDRPYKRREFGARRTATSGSSTVPATGGRSRTSTPPHVSSEVERQNSSTGTRRGTRSSDTNNDQTQQVDPRTTAGPRGAQPVDATGTTEPTDPRTTVRPGMTADKPTSQPDVTPATRRNGRTDVTADKPTSQPDVTPATRRNERTDVTADKPTSQPDATPATRRNGRTDVTADKPTSQPAPVESRPAQTSGNNTDSRTKERPAAQQPATSTEKDKTSTRRESRPAQTTRRESRPAETTRRESSDSDKPAQRRPSRSSDSGGSSGSTTRSGGRSSAPPSAPAPSQTPSTQRGGRNR